MHRIGLLGKPIGYIDETQSRQSIGVEENWNSEGMMLSPCRTGQEVTREQTHDNQFELGQALNVHNRMSMEAISNVSY